MNNDFDITELPDGTFDLHLGAELIGNYPHPPRRHPRSARHRNGAGTMNVTVLKEVDGQLVPIELKAPPVPGLPGWARPIPVPKHVKLLVREGVKIPPKHVAYTKANMEHVKIRDRVAVCRGLPKRVRGCDWEVVSVHDRGETGAAAERVRAADPLLGVALVLLDSGGRAIKLLDEGGKEI